MESRPWKSRLHELVWQDDQKARPRWQRFVKRMARILYVLARDLGSGELTLRAMGLVYTTLLSLVPLLALSFSILKGFGVHNQIQPILQGFLAPLGERADDLTLRIIGFIDNVNVGVLGAAGLALLVYTVISLMQKIEESLNFIWHVPRSRSFGERFMRYLSVLLIGPLLAFSAIGITGSVLESERVREALAWTGLAGAAVLIETGLPYVLVVSALLFAYVFIPNTRVRIGPAFAGALIGGLLWLAAGWGFAVFAGSSTRYSAIYSGFAIVILIMLWLYLSWLIVLFGASIAFYCQYPQYLLPLGGEPRLSNRVRERVALAAAVRIARAYSDGTEPPTEEELAARLGVPVHGVTFVLDALIEGGLLAKTEDGRYFPARDLHGVSVNDVLQTVRSAGEKRYVTPDLVPLSPAVQQTLDRAEAENENTLGRINLMVLARAERQGEGSGG